MIDDYNKHVGLFLSQSKQYKNKKTRTVLCFLLIDGKIKKMKFNQKNIYSQISTLKYDLSMTHIALGNSGIILLSSISINMCQRKPGQFCHIEPNHKNENGIQIKISRKQFQSTI